MSIFFWGIPFIEKCILGGLGSRKTHHFGKIEFIDLAKVVIGTPCNAYVSEYLRSSIFQQFYGSSPLVAIGPEWSSMVFSPEYPRIFLGDPRHSQVSPWFSVGFPGKKINWIEVQNPPCLHTFRKVYVAIGSCQWCPPQSIHFQVQYPYQ